MVYSLLYRLLMLLKNFFKRIADTFVKLNKYSLVYRFYKFMINSSEKEPHIKKSLFYKVMALLGGLLKKAAVWLKGFFRRQAESSIFWKLVKDVDHGFRENPYVLSGLLTAGFFVAYTAAAILRGNTGKLSLGIIAVLFTAAATLLLVREKLKDIICASLSYKVIKMAMKAVSP